MATTTLQRARSQLGGACRSGDPDRIREARRDYHVAVLDDRISTIVGLAHDLTGAQRARLAELVGI